MIDAHQHFWNYDPEKYSWIGEEMSAIRRDFTPEDLEPVLRKNGFTGSIVVQARQEETETAELLQIASENDFIKGVVGWVDLNAENVEQRLEKFTQNQFFKGVRHTVWDEKGEFMLASDFQRGILALENFNLTYDILAFDYQLESAVELVKKFPEQPFMLNHCGNPKIPGAPDPGWEQNIRELASSENVYCKISGLIGRVENSEKKEDFFPFLDVLSKTFGIGRLVFGSDWPVCLVASDFEEVFGLVDTYFESASGEDREKIFGRNAAEFYNLKSE